MPVIPGVPSAAQKTRVKMIKVAAIVLGGLLLVAGGRAWLKARSSHIASVPDEQEAAPVAAPIESEPAPVARPTAVNEIGTREEFDRPWAAKKFSYSSPLTHEAVPAIAIRLPNGDGHSSASYWGILLKAPFGQCELEYLTDLKVIASRFGYNATHPMIADACSGTLYDPLRTGTLPNGSWARGDIVQGSGFRPPLQVEILVQGDKLVAGRSED